MMHNLFDNDDYLGYKFPEPQYLGAKFIHREWIAKFIPESADTVLDTFGGSQSVAYLMKQLGKRTLTNDFMRFNCHIGKALVENPGITLTSDDTDVLFSGNSNPEEYDLMESLFTDLFFTREEAAFADSFRSNVPKLDHPYKQSLALAVMCRSMTRKVTMGHFAHTQSLNYAADPARVKRNRSLIRPLKELFLELLPQYNAAVFDNRKHNESYNENVLDLLPKLDGVDLVYFDPPYCNRHADYQSFYHLLETFVEYWKDKQFVNGTKRYEPKRYSGFDKNCEAIFETVIQSESYTTSIPPGIEYSNPLPSRSSISSRPRDWGPCCICEDADASIRAPAPPKSSKNPVAPPDKDIPVDNLMSKNSTSSYRLLNQLNLM